MSQSALPADLVDAYVHEDPEYRRALGLDRCWLGAALTFILSTPVW